MYTSMMLPSRWQYFTHLILLHRLLNNSQAVPKMEAPKHMKKTQQLLTGVARRWSRLWHTWDRPNSSINSLKGAFSYAERRLGSAEQLQV